ncbi:hypothetical protein [Noviherbaspirillum sedimenti]|uniref:hypothetical protein n=1 Tax=Noviherbaspirillum sedimenti TaxID=2320865 RepID=UPI001314FD51|nr:hypothetical protein [Noviherbaspirillum sedimenti]
MTQTSLQMFFYRFAWLVSVGNNIRADESTIGALALPDIGKMSFFFEYETTAFRGGE